jgi:hypothetical protein
VKKIKKEADFVLFNNTSRERDNALLVAESSRGALMIQIAVRWSQDNRAPLTSSSAVGRPIQI